MMRQDGTGYRFPGSKAHDSNLNTFIRGRKSLDRSPEQPVGQQIAQYERHNSMNGQYETLVASRARCTALESQSEAARKHWDQLLKQYHQSQLRYEVAVDPYSHDPNDHPPDMPTLRDRLMNSGRDLEGHSTRVRAIERDYQEARTTFDLEFARLIIPSDPQPRSTVPSNPRSAWISPYNPHSIASNSAYTHTTYATQPDRRPSWPTPASSILDPMHNAAPDLETLREDYFKWAADVNIYGEQLAEHNYDYLTARTDRERRQDQDEILLITDEEFDADANRRRDVITKALDEAIDNADRLKAECESLGIDLNPERRNIWDLEDVALSEAETEAREEYRKAFEAAIKLVPQEAFENAELVLASPSEHGSETLDYSAPSERTESWLEALSPDPDANEQAEDSTTPVHA
ncbi:hypothetical protein Q7P35_005112 [Cladosporium inversicolor]